MNISSFADDHFHDLPPQPGLHRFSMIFLLPPMLNNTETGRNPSVPVRPEKKTRAGRYVRNLSKILRRWEIGYGRGKVDVFFEGK